MSPAARRDQPRSRRWRSVVAAVFGGLVVAVGQLVVAPLFEEDPPPPLVEQVVHSDACGDVAILTSSYRADEPAQVRDALADDPGLVYCTVAVTDDDELVHLLATMWDRRDAPGSWSGHARDDEQARSRRDWVLRMAASTPGWPLPGAPDTETVAADIGAVMAGFDRLDDVPPEGTDTGLEARVAIEVHLTAEGLDDDHRDWLATTDPGADGAPPAQWLPDTPAGDPAAQQVERLYDIVRRARGNM